MPRKQGAPRRHSPSPPPSPGRVDPAGAGGSDAGPASRGTPREPGSTGSVATPPGDSPHVERSSVPEASAAEGTPAAGANASRRRARGRRRASTSERPGPPSPSRAWVRAGERPRAAPALLLTALPLDAGAECDAPEDAKLNDVLVRPSERPRPYDAAPPPRSRRPSAMHSGSRTWNGWRDWPRSDALLEVCVVRDGCATTATLDMRMPGAAPALVLLADARRLEILWRPHTGPRVILLQPPTEEKDASKTMVKNVVECHRLSEATAVMLRWTMAKDYGGLIQDDLYLGVDWLYDAVRRTASDDAAEWGASALDAVRSAAAKLSVTLRPYQERAVAWMLLREKGNSSEASDVHEKIEEPWTLWTPCDAGFDDAVDADGADECLGGFVDMACVNPTTGDIHFGAKHPPEEAPAELFDVRGGLLCDEMGLGKTVEVLTLVMANPRVNLPLADQPSVRVYSNRVKHDCVECTQAVQIRVRDAFESGDASDADRETLDPFSKTFRMGWVVCRECYGVAHRTCSGALPYYEEIQRGYVCRKCCEKFSVGVQGGAFHKSRATLIVAPRMLLHQWQDELARHGPQDLKVVTFEGLKGPEGYVPVHQMLNADIVLTTYSALHTDVSVVQYMRSDRRLRFRRKYAVPPTPLMSVDWWRVCLDEAQMVSNGRSACAQMANELSCRFRWCVTGTPIRHHVEELLGCFKFLSAESAVDWRQWEDGRLRPAENGFATDVARLGASLRKCMWRTNKVDVEGTELQLPPQVVEVARVNFGVVEKFFYSEVLSVTRREIREQESRYGDADVVPPHTHLERLRQACCHPQVGSVGRRILFQRRWAFSRRLRGSVAKRKASQAKPQLSAAASAQLRAENPMTMGEVLGSLVERARCACEDAQRDYAASSNGLAATLLLIGGNTNVVAAVRTYREVLECRERNKTLFELDKIQRLHVLYNLRDVVSTVNRTLDEMPESSAEYASLRDAARRRPCEMDTGGEIEAIRQHYMRDSRARVKMAMASFRETRDDVNRFSRRSGRVCNSRVVGNAGPGSLSDDDEICASTLRGKGRRENWWTRAFGIVMEKCNPEAFLERIVQGLMEQHRYARAGEVMSSANSLAVRMHSAARMESAVSEAVEELHRTRDALITRLETLPGAQEATKQQICESAQCMSCRGFDAQGTSCAHCEAEHLLNDYEGMLYSIAGRKEMSEKRELFRHTGGHVGLVINRAMRHRQPVQPPVAAYRRRSDLEFVMRSLASVVREHGDQQARDSMEAWMQMLDRMKRELDLSRSAFDAQRNLLAELDELDQAIQRITLVPDGIMLNSLSVHEQMFTVSREMLPALKSRFEAERAAGEAELHAKKSDLIYLSSLENHADEDAGVDDEPDTSTVGQRCPICLLDFGAKMALYECGHAFCPDCVTFLIRRIGRKSGFTMNCPTCRRKSSVDEIRFAVRETLNSDVGDSLVKKQGGCIPSQCHGPALESSSVSQSDDLEEVQPVDVIDVPKGTEEPEDNAPLLQRGERESTFLQGTTPVEGAHLSSKTSAIVRVLKSIAATDAGAKTLIFSQWREVLMIVASALRTNGIDHCWLETPRTSRKKLGGGISPSSLEEFKASLTMNVLLVLMRTGATGLNIVEATHVFLVEPWLNPAMEAQAISRVHRLSQTKPTFVHRFIVSDTVEDKIRGIAVGKEGVVQSGSAEVASVEEVRSMLE